MFLTISHEYSHILTDFNHIPHSHFYLTEFLHLTFHTFLHKHLQDEGGGAYTTLPKRLPVVWYLVQSQLTSDHLRVGSTYREVFSVTKIRFRHQTLKPQCLIIIYVVSMSENTKILCKNYSVLCSHCIICNHYSY